MVGFSGNLADDDSLWVPMLLLTDGRVVAHEEPNCSGTN
jgi:hypothetical protein